MSLIQTIRPFLAVIDFIVQNIFIFKNNSLTITGMAYWEDWYGKLEIRDVWGDEIWNSRDMF